MPKRIAIVEDEAELASLIDYNLARHGYQTQILRGDKGTLEELERARPDLIVLDVMLPKLDGFALCAELRRVGNRAPVLFLTARSQVEDRVTGLDAGGDDYLVKPFSREELLARVRALWRRVQRQAHELTTVSFGRVKIDFVRQQAWREGRPLELTPKEFAVLRLLLERPGEVISRDRFLDVVWGYAAFPTTRTVDRHIVSLRQKLEDRPEQPRWIITVHGTGYRLELPSEVTEP